MVAAETVDHDRIGCLEVRDCHLSGKTRYRDHPVVVGDGDDIIGIGRIDDDRIDLTVAAGAADLSSEVDIDLADGGPRQVVDGNVVRAAQGVEVDRFDAIEVHRDCGDVAGKQGRQDVGQGAGVDL